MKKTLLFALIVSVLSLCSNHVNAAATNLLEVEKVSISTQANSEQITEVTFERGYDCTITVHTGYVYIFDQYYGDYYEYEYRWTTVDCVETPNP